MDEKTKELVAIGASVAANCYIYMKQHVAKCDEIGVARAEVRAAAEVGKMVNRVAATNTHKFVDELLGAEKPVPANWREVARTVLSDEALRGQTPVGKCRAGQARGH